MISRFHSICFSGWAGICFFVLKHYFIKCSVNWESWRAISREHMDSLIFEIISLFLQGLNQFFNTNISCCCCYKKYYFHFSSIKNRYSPTFFLLAILHLFSLFSLYFHLSWIFKCFHWIPFLKWLLYKCHYCLWLIGDYLPNNFSNFQNCWILDSQRLSYFYLRDWLYCFAQFHGQL